MGNYRILRTKGFQEDLEEIKAAQSDWISRKLDHQIYPQLQYEPHYGLNIKRIKSVKPTVWRYRIGSFRLFYHIIEEEKIVILDTIEHRKEAYR